MISISNLSLSRDVQLHVITPISGNLRDLSRLETTRSAAKFYAIRFIYIIDTDSDVEFQRISDSISNNDRANVELIHVNVKSPGLARNAGLEKIVKGWICFWDADDLPRVSEFYEMVVSADKNFQSICIGGFEIADQSGDVKGHFPLSENRERILFDIGMNPGLWRFGFQRELIGKIRFREYRMAEDQLFLAEIDFNFDKMLAYRDSVYRYFNVVPGQLTRDASAMKDILKTYREMYLRLRPRISPLSEMTTLMLTRQLLTGVKRLPLMDKFRVIRFGIFVIFISNGLRIQFLKCFCLIYRTKKG